MSNQDKEVRMDVPYFQVPNKIFEVEDISIYAKMTYMYLARCGNQGKQAFPSYKTIADKCGMSRRKAIDSVKELIENKLLRKTERKIKPDMNKTNLYEVLNPSAHHSLGSAQHSPPSAQDAPNKELMYKELDIKKEGKRDGDTNQSPSYQFLHPRIQNIINQEYECSMWIQENIEYYLDMYKHYRKEKHPKMKLHQWQEVFNNITHAYDDRNNTDIELLGEVFENIVQQHFETKYKAGCDYRLLHFISGSNIANRYYELYR